MFRFISLFALTPLLLMELHSYRAILNGIALWSGVVWVLLFYRLFSDSKLRVSTAMATLLGTMFLVLPAFEWYLSLPPQITDYAIEQPQLLTRFAGYVLGVGVREEVAKAIAVVVALLFTQGGLRPLHGLVLGMMAGVGFAVSENVYYVYGMLGDAVEHTRQTGEASALIVPIYANVVRMMVGPFAHGVFSGIVGYHLALAVSKGNPRLAGYGLALAAFLHGTYDLVVGLSVTLGVLVLCWSYFFLMKCLLAAREGSSAGSLAAGVFQHTVLR